MNTIIRSAALASCLFAASAAVGIADANEGDISAARAEGRISATIALNRDLRGRPTTCTSSSRRNSR